MSKYDSPEAVEAYRRLSRNMDMEKLETFLEEASEDKFEQLLAMMHDPEYSKKTMGQLAKLCKISVTELQNLYMDGQRQLAMLRMSSSLPEIMDDVAEDARTKMETCPRCDGLQVIQFGENGTRACPTCKGKGEIRRMGDKHSRDLVFESAKLTGQKVPMVAIQQNFSSGDDRMESILKKTRNIVLEEKNG